MGCGYWRPCRSYGQGVDRQAVHPLPTIALISFQLINRGLDNYFVVAHSTHSPYCYWFKMISKEMIFEGGINTILGGLSNTKVVHYQVTIGGALKATIDKKAIFHAF